MKKLLAITVLVAGFAISSQAQQASKSDSTRNHRPAKEWKAKHNLNNELNLTADQKQQMKAVNEEFRTKAEEIKKNTTLTDAQKKEQFKTLHTQKMEKQKAILTPEQQQKFAQLKKAHNRKGNKEGRSK